MKKGLIFCLTLLCDGVKNNLSAKASSIAGKAGAIPARRGAHGDGYGKIIEFKPFRRGNIIEFKKGEQYAR
jgi:hypothetical protein